MSIYDLPTALQPVNASWGLRKAGAMFRSPFNGRTQAIDYLAERWVFSAALAPMMDYAAGEMEAFGTLMAGGINRVRAGHPTRKVPRGTLRGTPTVQTAAGRGDLSLALSVAAGSTLEAGDFIGVAGHLLQVAQACSAIGGVLTVPLTNRIRGSIAVGTAVTWDRPTTVFLCTSMLNSAIHMPGYVEGVALDFEEDYS